MNNATTIVALAKVVKEKSEEYIAARKAVKAGSYDVDTVVHIKGTMNVGEDDTAVPTVSVPLKEALALFVMYSGITRDAAMAALLRACSEAIAIDGKAQGAIAESIKGVEAAVTIVEQRVLALLPRISRKGKVTTKLTATELEAMPVAA